MALKHMNAREIEKVIEHALAAAAGHEVAVEVKSMTFAPGDLDRGILSHVDIVINVAEKEKVI